MPLHCPLKSTIPMYRFKSYYDCHGVFGFQKGMKASLSATQATTPPGRLKSSPFPIPFVGIHAKHRCFLLFRFVTVFHCSANLDQNRTNFSAPRGKRPAAAVVQRAPCAGAVGEACRAQEDHEGPADASSALKPAGRSAPKHHRRPRTKPRGATYRNESFCWAIRYTDI